MGESWMTLVSLWQGQSWMNSHVVSTGNRGFCMVSGVGFGCLRFPGFNGILIYVRMVDVNERLCLFSVYSLDFPHFRLLVS
jgi:hypothetical protein